MSATYDPTLPTAKDRMRLLLGDTDVSTTETTLLPDETYLATIAERGETAATVMLAQGLASQYAQAPTTVSANGKTVSWPDRVKTWQAIVARLSGELVEVVAVSTDLNVVRPRRRGEEAYAEYERPEGWYPGW